MKFNNFSKIFSPEMRGIQGKIKESTKQVIEDKEGYNTGLVGEAIIIGAYKTMPIEKLEKLKYILCKILEQKKKAENCAKAQRSAISVTPIYENPDIA